MHVDCSAIVMHETHQHPLAPEGRVLQVLGVDERNEWLVVQLQPEPGKT